MCIGEAPGQFEDRVGKPFIGPAGDEFNQNYLQLAGLHRDEVYVTNTRKCRPGLNRKPTTKEAWDCASHHLPDELASVCPEIVVLMGATACGLIPDDPIDLEVEHGIPRPAALFGWVGWVVPMYHPALGLHNTSYMTEMLEDWEGLREWLVDGGWRWAVDVRAHDYRLVERETDLREYCRMDRSYQYCAVDTETHDGMSYSIQISHTVGTGRMVKIGHAVLGDLVWWMNEQIKDGMELILHNGPADLPMLDRLYVRGFKWRDTMQEAYQMGNLPQSLKALSYRLLGRRRRSWEETVSGPSREKVCEWLMNAIDHAARHWTTKTERRGKKGNRLKPKVTPSVMEVVLSSVLKHTLRNETYDVWDKLQERTEKIGGLETLSEIFGPVPTKGIAHVSMKSAVEYGCSDADDTLAVAIRLEELRRGVGADVREEDFDAVRRG